MRTSIIQTPFENKLSDTALEKGPPEWHATRPINASQPFQVVKRMMRAAPSVSEFILERVIR
jgi:hypothetical protein